MGGEFENLIEALVARFIQFSQVEVVALGGSRAAGSSDSSSDIDLYIFTSSEIQPTDRLATSREFYPAAHLNDFWGPGVEWVDPVIGVHCDIVFFDTAWVRGQLERSILQYQGGTGYSTCFWHTILHAQLLYDRGGWLASLRELASSPYPEELTISILGANYPILRHNESAYFHQIEKAINRGDLVSINHRAAEFLASYFDILFAINHLPHPGEKRLIETAERLCALLPEHFSQDVRALINSIPLGNQQILTDLTRLLDRLDYLLDEEGYAPAEK